MDTMSVAFYKRAAWPKIKRFLIKKREEKRFKCFSLAEESWAIIPHAHEAGGTAPFLEALAVERMHDSKKWLPFPVEEDHNAYYPQHPPSPNTNKKYQISNH